MMISIGSILDDPLLFFYILRAVAIIVALAAIGSTFSTIRFLIRSTRTIGSLVRWDAVKPWDRRYGGNTKGQRTSYLPVVSFTAADGTPHQVSGDVLMRSGGGKPRKPLGTELPVRYVPGRPEEARIATIVNLWFFPFLSVLIAAVLMGLFFR